MYKRILLLIIAILLLLISGKIFLFPPGPGTLTVIKAAGGEAGSYALYTEDGDIIFANQIEGIRKSLMGSYSVRAQDITIDNVIGIIENPPAEGITDIYGMVSEAMNNNRVLIIYIDGLGYDLYKRAAENGHIPYIASLGEGVKAFTVYPSITDVTFAAMVTGRTPRYTGIHSREKKLLTVPTVFDAAAEKGRSSKLIEGDMRIIIEEVQTVLNIDENKNGTIDDEIFNCAMKEMAAPPELLLVHFHSYDDFGHKYGPDSEEALARLGVLDSYTESLLKEYTGMVIITSDHGMHESQDGGAHGTFSAEDMFIPIITIN